MDNKEYKKLLIEILQRSLITNNTTTALNTVKELQSCEAETKEISNSEEILKELELLPNVLIKQENCMSCQLANWFDRYADAKNIEYVTIQLTTE